MPRKCNCGKQAKFNFLVKTIGEHCRGCMLPGMVNVVDNLCPCGKYANFNSLDKTIGEYCKECMLPGMVDVVHKKCPCGVRPLFNSPGEKRGKCCISCKEDGMIDVMSKKCACGVTPYFNSPDKTRGEYCFDCKTDGMIDVVTKKCPCGKHKTFNFPGITPGERCFMCKSPGMIHIYNKVCPGYNGECPVRTQLGRGQKYCMSCDPNEDRKKRFKRYENAFFDYITGKIHHGRNETVSFDSLETSKKRVFLDGIVFGDGVVVCLEVDENKHKGAYYECDEARTHLATAELLQKYPGNDISWVRVNPTVKAKDQWSTTSKKKREKLFSEAVDIINEILTNKGCDIKYVGF